MLSLSYFPKIAFAGASRRGMQMPLYTAAVRKMCPCSCMHLRQLLPPSQLQFATACNMAICLRTLKGVLQRLYHDASLLLPAPASFCSRYSQARLTILFDARRAALLQVTSAAKRRAARLCLAVWSPGHTYRYAANTTQPRLHE